MPKPTIGQQIVAFLPEINTITTEAILRGHAESIAAAIDKALEDAFKLGFDHAVVGGHDAASKLPQLRNKMPLIMYFDNEEDRQEMVDAVRAAKPMTEVRLPRKG